MHLYKIITLFPNKVTKSNTGCACWFDPYELFMGPGDCACCKTADKWTGVQSKTDEYSTSNKNGTVMMGRSLS